MQLIVEELCSSTDLHGEELMAGQNLDPEHGLCLVLVRRLSLRESRKS